MRIIKFSKNDILVMKKKHPCGSDRFRVQRSGSDVRIICLGCARDTTLPRLKLEKNIKSVIPAIPSEDASGEINTALTEKDKA